MGSKGMGSTKLTTRARIGWSAQPAPMGFTPVEQALHLPERP
jgi:hypothetical protein